jgi:hypothetical protein
MTLGDWSCGSGRRGIRIGSIGCDIHFNVVESLKNASFLAFRSVTNIYPEQKSFKTISAGRTTIRTRLAARMPAGIW